MLKTLYMVDFVVNCKLTRSTNYVEIADYFFFGHIVGKKWKN